MAALDDDTRALLEAPNLVQVGTIGQDGQPHITPAWVDVEDDGTIMVNTAEGRVWPANLRRDPRVTINVSPPDNPYVYTSIRGRAVGDTHEGADAHIDKLAKKYLGADEYPYREEGQQRVIFRIEPEKVSKLG
jgi:PPOX class probable F420-dependent enzyme